MQACHVDPGCQQMGWTSFDAAATPLCAPCSACQGDFNTTQCTATCNALIPALAADLQFQNAVQLDVGDASGAGLENATLAAILNQTDVE
jgi:hypothetical protein